MLEAVRVTWLLLVFVPLVFMDINQDRRGDNTPPARINETRYFGDLLELALKDIGQADVIFKFGGPEYSANISNEGSVITLSNCNVTDIQNISLRSTTYEIYYLYGGKYPFFTGYYSFASPKLTYDYSIKNSTSGEVLSSGLATLQLTDESSQVWFYVDNNSTGQYHILHAAGAFDTLGELASVELTNTSDANVKKAVAQLFKRYDFRIQVVPTTALNSYILKYMRLIDFNDYIIKK